jgi:glycosyltransferase involved in cell wall biosynthesis
MKKKLLIVGPLPPPLHGESLAINSVVTSEKVQKIYNIKTINTNRKVVNKAGKFSLKKILKDIYLILKVFISTVFVKKEIFYISISQTKLGLLRDLIMIKIAAYRSNLIVTHLHGNNLGAVIDNMSGASKYFQEKALSKVDIGIVLGESLKKNYRGYVKDVKVLSNGIPSEFIKDRDFELAMHERENRKELRVLYLSNLIEEKGYKILIHSCIKLLLMGYKLKLTLAGDIYDSEGFKRIMNIVKDNNLESSIEYIGLVSGNDKKKLLLDSDIMVLPTTYKIEGQPISIVEGMAAGLPIISTQKGCITDLVKQNGVLLDNVTTEELEKKLESFCLNRGYILECGYKSRQYFVETFTLEKHISKLISIFQKSEEVN